jgi:hypothetical protein
MKYLNIFFIALATLSSCTPESSTKDLGALPTPSFTAVPVDGKPYKIVVKSTTPAAFMWRWNYKNTRTAKRETDTLSFPWKGEYTIQLTAFGQGGYAIATQNVSIPVDVPVKDILKGGDMEAGSEQYWTKLNTGGIQTLIDFNNGVMTFNNTGNSNSAIYQAIKVTAGKEYIFSGTVKGNGATNSWFEVYFSTTVPKQGSDYSGTKYIGLSTWDGCGAVPFDGNLAEIGCSGSGKGERGSMMFNTSDSIYLVIKAGSSDGGNLGTGITLDDVKFMEEL